MEYLETLLHPTEAVSLCRVLWRMSFAKDQFQPQEEHRAFGYRMLDAVSRSFSPVIKGLCEELRDPICVFYLALRALDTIEDDTSVEPERRVADLKAFHERVGERGVSIEGYGQNSHEVELMLHYHYCVDMFLELKEKYQDIIRDTAKEMGLGMASFIEANRGVETVKDWDEYCYYVAGTVGVGLSRMFAAYGVESEEFASPRVRKLAISMGLFLQKTNIIRDYLEDVNLERFFWPIEIWKKYTENVETFKEPQDIEKAVACLNDLITNALQHATDCLEYMSLVRDPTVFAFVGIPQVMAIATLAKIYDNPDVFRMIVRTRRSLGARLILHTHCFRDVYETFEEQCKMIESKNRRVPRSDVLEKTVGTVKSIRAAVEQHRKVFGPDEDETIPRPWWKHPVVIGVPVAGAVTVGTMYAFPGVWENARKWWRPKN